MKTFETLEHKEQNEIVDLFANWLNPYTHEVIIKVLKKRDEIINNSFVIDLLKELKTRTEKEQKEFTDTIHSLFYSFDTFAEFDPHKHALTHAGSYRDILYDMYIRD